MKVIIINENGAYRYLNGHTLQVKTVNNQPELNELFCAVLVPDPLAHGGFATVDMPLKNILLVDAKSVAQDLYDAKNWGTPGSLKAWNGFCAWARTHGFKFKPEYNCPA